MPTDQRTVTPRRRAANQAAAQQSTGPRTEKGKARSAQNSFRHGAFAQTPASRHGALERSGSAARYESLRQSLASDWRPSTPQQEQLVDSLAWLTFLRNEAQRAFLNTQERLMMQEPVDRERERWRERNWAPPATDDACFNTGLAVLPTSEDKFERLGVVLAELRRSAEKCAWNAKLPGLSEHPRDLQRLLCGDAPRTARLRKLKSLLYKAQLKEGKRGDAINTQILALLGELEQGLADERALFEHERAVKREVEALEEAEGPALFPMDEQSAGLLRQMEQLERQINAKIRLLLRLERRAEGGEGGAQTANAVACEPPARGTGAVPWGWSRFNGTKPTEPLESVDLIEADREKARAYCLQLGIEWEGDPEPGGDSQGDDAV